MIIYYMNSFKSKLSKIDKALSQAPGAIKNKTKGVVESYKINKANKKTFKMSQNQSRKELDEQYWSNDNIDEREQSDNPYLMQINSNSKYLNDNGDQMIDPKSSNGSKSQQNIKMFN